MIDILSGLIAGLDNKQLEKLKSSITDVNERIENRIKKKRTNEILKRYEFFFDDLTQEQKKFVDSKMSIYQGLNAGRLKNRLAFQKDFWSILNGNKNVIEKHKALKARFIKNLDGLKSPERFSKVMVVMDEFIKMTNKTQRKHFKKQKRMIISWLDAIIKEAQKGEG